jgi:hypothetical protein
MTSQLILMYVLKTVIVSGIFFGYYWLALRDKKFHYYNRFFLLLSLTLSLIIPLFNFSWFTVQQPVLYGSAQVFNFMIESGKSRAGIQLDWMDWSLIAIGIVGVGLLLLLCINIIKIFQLKQKAEVTHMDGFDFMSIEEEEAPFSFLDNLFWKKSISLNDTNGQKIFKHEITHIQQKHTWDRLCCQLVSSVLWMNPFNWLIQKELQTIHEFIADEEAVGNSDVASFAQMLLQTHYGNHFLNPSHSFFYSSIKRRLIMLTTSKKTKYSYVRRVMVLPLLVLAVGIFSVKVNATESITSKVSEVKNVLETNANLLVERVFINDTSKPKVIIKKTPPPPPKSIAPPPAPGFALLQNDNAPNPSDGVVIESALNKPLLVVDGKVFPALKMEDIDPNTIESINVFKDANYTKKYGTAGKNGVIEIITKLNTGNKSKATDQNDEAVPNALVIMHGTGVVNDADKTVHIKGVGEVNGAKTNPKERPLFLVDGIATSEEAVSKINPNDIKSVNVIKDKASLKIYGDKAKYGVVSIVTHKRVS